MLRDLLTTAIVSGNEPVFDRSGLEPIDWAKAAVVLVAGIAIAIVLRRAVVSLLRRGTTVETMSERLIGRIVQVVVVLLALSYTLSLLGVKIAPLLGALGIGGLAIALALQETLKNLFAGVVLHAQRPMQLGEEVISGDMQGTVTDITSRAITLRSNSGRILTIPNSLALDREIVNLVRFGTRRTTATVGVAYSTDLALATRVLKAATESAGGVLETPAPRVLCSEFADSSINFEIDFWHGPDETARRETTSNVLLAIATGLEQADITIPFPQRTLWFPADEPPSGD